MTPLSVWFARVLGVLGLGAALLVALRPLVLAGVSYSWASASVLLALQVLLSILLLYAAEQRRLGSDIAEKAFPAVVMAVLLWCCMFVYWLRQLA